MKQVKAKQDDFVILESDNWWIFDDHIWRKMTAEEQIAASS